MSSSVIRKTLIISRFAANDFPEPGVPKKRPLGLLSRGTFLGWGKRNQKAYNQSFFKKELNKKTSNNRC